MRVELGLSYEVTRWSLISKPNGIELCPSINRFNLNI